MNRKEWSNVSETVDILTDDRVDLEFDVLHSGYDYPAIITADPDFSQPPEFDIEIELVECRVNGDVVEGEKAADLFEDYYQEIFDKITGDER